MRVAAFVTVTVGVGCSGGAETSTPVAARPAIETETKARPAEEEGDCGTGWSDESNAASATAPFDQIDVQLDTQATYGISYNVAGGMPFSRFPAFTLYRDRTVFYPRSIGEESPASFWTAKLDRAAADEIRARVLALGAEQLKSHVDSCSCPKDGPGGKAMVCIDDSRFTMLRFRSASGELRHVVVYASFWNRGAVAKQITDYLSGYRAPGATPFVPTRATFAVLRSEAGDCAAPLDAATAKLLAPPQGFLHVKVVEGDELRRLQTKLPPEGGRDEWCTRDATLRGNLYPSLPGMDHRPFVASYLSSMRN